MIMEKAYHHLKVNEEENRHQKQVKKEDKAVKEDYHHLLMIMEKAYHQHLKEDKAVKMNLRIA
jgi:Na+-transporting methylmalonyl-CoA/oxaloacetate decarboxylase gamma subunit